MENNNDIRSLVKVFNSYRLLIVLCGIVFAAIGLFSNLSLPKVYQGEAVVSLPKIAGADPKNENMGFVNVPETRAVINLFMDRLRRGSEAGFRSDSFIQKLRLVRIDDIRGSDNYFKMIVQAENDPKTTLAAMDHMLAYLQNNQYLMSRYEIKKAELEADLLDASLAAERADKVREEAVKLVRGRNNVGFNPVNLETEMNELRGRYNNFKTKLALAHSYQYVDWPYVRKNPVSPRPWKNLFIFGFLGLLLGIMTAMMIHFVRTVIVPGVPKTQT